MRVWQPEVGFEKIASEFKTSRRERCGFAPPLALSSQCTEASESPVSHVGNPCRTDPNPKLMSSSYQMEFWRDTASSPSTR
jgi:hypothetical protein